MKWINVSYAGYFNRKYQRNGHLFQGRFKSILVDADAYLKQLGEYFGDVSGAAITLRYNFLAKQVAKNKKLKTRTNKLINKIINN